MSELTIEKLDDALDQLTEAHTSVHVRADHLFPDLALLGFARDVLENGRSTAMIWRSGTARPAFTTARGAFEAVIDLLFLGTREDDYDYWGARARVAELMDWKTARELAEEVDAGPLPDMMPIDEQLAVDAAAWDELSPGKGQVLLDAWADVEKDRSNHRWHWSGMSRMALPEKFAEATGGDETTASMYRSWYNVLSIHAHPAPRIEGRHLQIVDGGFEFQIDYPDPSEIAAPALGSAYVAAVAARTNLLEKLPTE